jgi:hypothetical protein
VNPPAVPPPPSGPLAFGAAIAPKLGPPATGTDPAVGPNAGTNAGTDHEGRPSESFAARQDPPAPGTQTARAVKAAATAVTATTAPAPVDPLSASQQQPTAARGFAAADFTMSAPANATAAAHGVEPQRAVSEIAAPPAVPFSTAKQDLLLRVPAPESNSTAGANVDIRVIQRAGEVLVTVHTPDPALQANLRQDLPELVNSLDRAGFETVTFTPRTAALATTAASGAGLENGTAGNQADTPHSGGSFGSRSGNDPCDSGAPGQFSGEQHASGQHARNRMAQHWLDQMEE